VFVIEQVIPVCFLVSYQGCYWLFKALVVLALFCGMFQPSFFMFSAGAFFPCVLVGFHGTHSLLIAQWFICHSCRSIGKRLAILWIRNRFAYCNGSSRFFCENISLASCKCGQSLIQNSELVKTNMMPAPRCTGSKWTIGFCASFKWVLIPTVVFSATSATYEPLRQPGKIITASHCVGQFIMA